MPAGIPPRSLVWRPGRSRDEVEAGGRWDAKMTVYLSPELVRRLNTFAAHHGRDKSTVVEDALRAHLEAWPGLSPHDAEAEED